MEVGEIKESIVLDLSHSIPSLPKSYFLRCGLLRTFSWEVPQLDTTDNLMKMGFYRDNDTQRLTDTCSLTQTHRKETFKNWQNLDLNIRPCFHWSSIGCLLYFQNLLDVTATRTPEDILISSVDSSLIQIFKPEAKSGFLGYSTLHTIWEDITKTRHGIVGGKAECKIGHLGIRGPQRDHLPVRFSLPLIGELIPAS